MNRASNAAITEAAAMLLEAACTHRPLDTGARLHCLAAVDALVQAGAVAPGPSSTSNRPVAGLIRHALTLLAGLPIEVFDSGPILDATADARRALLLAG